MVREWMTRVTSTTHLRQHSNQICDIEAPRPTVTEEILPEIHVSYSFVLRYWRRDFGARHWHEWLTAIITTVQYSTVQFCCVGVATSVRVIGTSG